MTEKQLYRVAVTEYVNKKPQRNYVLVMATDAHTALDLATDHDAADELYDEPIQRAIVNGEISEHRVERKYSGYIETVDYVEEPDPEPISEDEWRDTQEQVSEDVNESLGGPRGGGRIT